VASSLFTVEDGRIQLNLHHGQQRAWDSTARFVFVLAGTQGGKTSFGPWWLLREILNRGRGDYLAVTATYDLFDLKLLPELLMVFEHTLGLGRLWPGIGVLEIADPVTRQFLAKKSKDPMWARVIMRSASAEGGLESATARGAWLDEAGQDAFTVSSWEAVLRRLSLSQGRVLATTTLYNTGWIKQQVFDPWRKGDDDFEVIQFDSTLNPLFSRREFERARRTMPTWKFNMFYRGEFSTPPGLIYSVYDDSIHAIPPFAIPNHWPRYVGIDPGAVNNASIWLAENPQTHVFYAYREILEGRKSTREHVAEYSKFRETENVVLWVGGAPSEQQFRADWTDEGLHVLPPPFGDVESGIDRVYSLLKEKRLFVFRDLLGLRDEFGRYSRLLDRYGNVTETIKDKNEFHRLDALRYAASRLDTAVSWSEVGTGNDTMPSPW
jgi:hypothetical protein